MTEISDSPFVDKNHLNVVNAITLAIAQSIELSAVLDTALDKVMEAFEVESGGIYLADSVTGRLKLQTQKGLTPGFIAEKADVPPGAGCAGWAVDRNEIFAAYDQPEASYICEDANRLMGLDCLLASPISTKSGVQGVLELFAPSSRRLTNEEAKLIQVISDQIGIAIENSRLHEESRQNVLKLTELQRELAATNRKLTAHLSQEVHIAEMLQKSLLPRKLPNVPGVGISTRLISATAAADVGGDFYDFIECEGSGKLAIVIGDVCGSGIEAATLTGMAKNTIRAFSFENADVESILTRTNRVLYAQADTSKFVAIFLGLLDLGSRELEYCVGGQPLPLLCRGGRVTEFEPGSMPLGVDPAVPYKPSRISLTEGDSIFFFTDGLIEARQGPELFGTEAVQKIIESEPQASLDNLLDDMLSAARTFGGGALRDDVAMIGMRLW